MGVVGVTHRIVDVDDEDVGSGPDDHRYLKALLIRAKKLVSAGATSSPRSSANWRSTGSRGN